MLNATSLKTSSKLCQAPDADSAGALFGHCRSLRIRLHSFLGTHLGSSLQRLLQGHRRPSCTRLCCWKEEPQAARTWAACRPQVQRRI